MRYLKEILRPPIFEDEVKTQQAYLLNIILWALICVPIPLVIYTFALAPENTNRILIQTIFGETVNIILLLMLHRGYVRPASIIQVSVFWVFLTVTAITGTGVQGEAYLLGYGLVIAIAGILLGGRGAIVFTFLSLATGGWMANGQMNGTIATGFESSPLTTWIISLVLFPVGATLQYLGARTAKLALARAQASEERYRLISRVSSDYTFSTVLNEEGKMRLNWVAGAFENISGFNFEEYVATGGWQGHLHPEDVDRDNQAFDKLAENQSIITEVRTYKKDHDIAWVRVYAHPVWDEKQNRLVGIVGGVQDITERKQTEAEREALIRELESKNAELERFTYTVSHDLKSPLVTITGYLGFLEKDALAGNTEKIKAGINRISNAAQKMQGLLNDLLELSRVGRLMNAPESIPFEEIVKEALDHVQGRLEANKVKVEVQGSLPTVYGDKIRLVEVMQNLVDNAAKFTKGQPDALIKIGTEENNEKMQPIFFVSDNGIGIAPQYHEKIFGLFDKLDPTAEGTGVGLTLVKRIIEVHGGKIWLESQPGNGTTFYFTLPGKPDKE